MSQKQARPNPLSQSHYLKGLKNPKVTPNQRRQIKRKCLKLSSNLIQFDANNYQADDLEAVLLDKVEGQISRRNSQFNENQINSPLKKSVKVTQSGLQQTMSQRQQMLKTTQIEPLNKSRHISKSGMRSRIQIKQVYPFHKQTQNPLLNYIQQDQFYQAKYQKIMQFQQLSKRKKNPFFTSNQAKQQNQGKLYLHKNKPDQYNLKNTLQQDQDQIINPFVEEQFEDQPNIVRNDTKLLKEDINAKKTRKDGAILDFIRSKYTLT